MQRIYLPILLLLSIFYVESNAQSNLEYIIKADRPAEFWEEAFPLGNGQTAAMVFGGISEDLIQLNDHTLWSGTPDPGNNPAAAGLLPVLRKQIFAKEYANAEATWRKMQGPYSARYLPLGDLQLQFDHQAQEAKNYIRTLDIQQAVSTVSYEVNGITYERSAFISNPAKALIIHIKADKKKSVSFRVRMSSKLEASSSIVSDQLVLKGRTPSIVAHRNYFPEQVVYKDKEGMLFEAKLAIKHKGGTLKTNGEFLEVKGADEATLYLTENTSFNGFDKSAMADGKDPGKEAAKKMELLLKKDYQTLKREHSSDFRRLFDRVEFQLGVSKEPNNLMTDDRIRNFEKDPTDFQLQTLLFQFGRYLLISSSRPGSRPANLQGIWNDKVQPPWGSNFTININTEMNYWLAENSNLSECHQPLLDFIGELAVNGKETAKVNYGIHEGWVAHHNSDLWAKTSPVGNFDQDKTYYPEAFCWQMGGAWLSLHLWEHFQYTQDKTFLSEKAYPLMKGAAQFMMHWLVEDPESGFLVTAPSSSPENHFNYQGKGYSLGKATTMDISIVRELFAAVIQASAELGSDAQFRKELIGFKERLYPFKIGKYGQLQEWSEDWDDPKDTHRHISHLFGLFPGTQISPGFSDDLVKAAKQTLAHRGDVSTGWSMAWKMNWWARLREGDRAYQILNKSFGFLEPVEKKVEKRRSGGGLYSNMFSGHPPFQIDANFGVTAGMIEMLMQSHLGEIRLLPALPSVWKNGRIKGIKARGNFELDMEWKDGEITRVEVISLAGKDCNLLFPNMVRSKSKNQTGISFQFKTKKGERYVFEKV